MPTPDRMPAEADPWAVLGISDDASDQDIRAAYLAKVREFPPDRAPEHFEEVRDAYDQLKDRRRRGARVLLHLNPDENLSRVLQHDQRRLRHVGVDPWLKAIKEVPRR